MFQFQTGTSGYDFIESLFVESCWASVLEAFFQIQTDSHSVMYCLLMALQISYIITIYRKTSAWNQDTLLSSSRIVRVVARVITQRPNWILHFKLENKLLWQLKWSWDRLGSIMTGLRAGWFGFQMLAGEGDLLLLQNVQTLAWVHPAANWVGTGSSFPGGKWLGAWDLPITTILCQG